MMISFRLSGTDLAWLGTQQIETDLNQAGELSLAVTAKRILLSTQNKGDDITEDSSEVTSSIIQNISEELEKKLDSRFEEMYHKMTVNLNHILDTRLALLEKPVTIDRQEVNMTEVTSEVTYDNTTENTVEVTPEVTTEYSCEVTSDNTTEVTTENSPKDTKTNIKISVKEVPLERRTVTELRAIAKGLDIPLAQTRGNKATMIKLINIARQK